MKSALSAGRAAESAPLSPPELDEPSPDDAALEAEAPDAGPSGAVVQAASMSRAAASRRGGGFGYIGEENISKRGSASSGGTGQPVENAGLAVSAGRRAPMGKGHARCLDGPRRAGVTTKDRDGAAY